MPRVGCAFVFEHGVGIEHFAQRRASGFYFGLYGDGHWAAIRVAANTDDVRALATLGLDRDAGLELLARDVVERDPAVKAMLDMAIKACLDQGKYVGICGQGPSDHPVFAKWLVEQGITSISLNPDSVVETWKLLAA